MLESRRNLPLMMINLLTILVNGLLHRLCVSY